MSPVLWALQPIKRYADFEGRSPRPEYWWFLLFQCLGYIALMIMLIVIAAASARSGGPGAAFWTLFALIFLAMLALLLPNLAVMIRRLHDQDVSGWFCLLFFIPYVGGIVAIVFMCIPGTKGVNRFGPDAYDTEYLGEVFA